MSTMATTARAPGSYTRADLEHTPDDGRRYPVSRPAEASLVAWELGPEGRYLQVAKVVGDEPFEARLPFPVTLVPADLVD
jgi:hypothetical protein